MGTLCIAQDMTEKNRLERTIREERYRLDAILRSMAQGVLVTDANYRFFLMHQTAEGLLGIPRHELIGKNLDSTTLPFTRADLDRQFRQGPNAEEMGSRARAWGSLMLDVVMTTLRDARGRPPGSVAVLHDITELMRMDQMKDEFMALVSHELRTPLTSVKGLPTLSWPGMPARSMTSSAISWESSKRISIT
jgi:PAS domain S-box-containing protein